ncbi:hypothetical protein TNCV_3645321 [Trichonephila clavipes]|nr:hypothetical protein TNCV_3645321 [Trichonephila clavipes]
MKRNTVIPRLTLPRLTLTRSYAIFKSRRFVFCLKTKKKGKEIGYVIEEVVNLPRQINLEVDSDDIQELLDSHNQELTIVELIAN